ncbi:MAG: SIS domain-containing protein [Candidatus Hodarchaeales archaeon]|jgi:6-phospho-3-hexuloisomerase
MFIGETQLKNLEEKGLKEFVDSYKLLTETARRSSRDFEFTPDPVLKICQMLKFCKDRTVHITGMGRSGKVGVIFGNMLKNQGYHVSLIGKTYARPVREEDLMIAFSGSGWTRTTALNLEDSLKNKAYTAAFTATQNSKIGRLADHIIPVDVSDITVKEKSKILGSIKKEKANSYDSRQLIGKKAPLTPMGTIFELTSMFITFAITSALVHDSPLYGFVRGASNVLNNADKTFCSITSNPDILKSVIILLENCSSVKNDNPPQVFCVGSGVSNVVGSISGMRFQHLKINMQSAYDWRFRKDGDVLIAISGSGETIQIVDYIKQASSSGMKVISLTSNDESTVAQESDYTLLIHGREKGKSSYVEVQPLDSVSRVGYHDPSFEYCAAVTCDAIVAQIAADLNISEDSMRQEHANIE